MSDHPTEPIPVQPPQGPPAYVVQPEYVAQPAYIVAPEASLPRRRGVGVVAFIAAMLSLVIGGIAITVAGYSISLGLRLTDYPNLVLEFEEQFWRTLRSVGWSVVWLAVAWIVHALLALWALIQGTVAAATGNGRMWGVIAIVVSLTAWIPLAALTQNAVLGGLSGLVPFVG